MPVILAIETSTKNCSVALADRGVVLAHIAESSDKYVHSEKLHVFLQALLKEAGLSFDQVEAVAVGGGPGSYTGLRIGVSAAKGLCYALQVPLISIDGLSLLAHDFINREHPGEGEYIIPMIDARRMEVYCAVFDHKGNRETPIEAKVIVENSFMEIPAASVHLIGDGAPKTLEWLTYPKFVIHDQLFPSSKALALMAEKKFSGREFEDVAYFEPFYLKDFIAGKPKKML